MVIRAYGVEGLRERIRRHCELARELAGWVEADDRFELLLTEGPPTRLVLQCWQASGYEALLLPCN